MSRTPRRKKDHPMTTIAKLPTIVRFLGTDDAGPGATCPHCGATGRYIVRFMVEGGRELGAMRGCAKLFPVSPLAAAQAALQAKAERYAKQRPPWSLNRRDREALDTIEAAIAGSASSDFALILARSAKAASSRRSRP